MDRVPGPPTTAPPAYAYKRGQEILSQRNQRIQQQQQQHQQQQQQAQTGNTEEKEEGEGEGEEIKQEIETEREHAVGLVTGAGSVAEEEPNEQLQEALFLLDAGSKSGKMGELHEDTLKSIFALLDADQDGLLDDAEVEQALVALGVPPLPFLVDEIKQHVPAWVGDKTDFDTFQRVMAQRLQSSPVQMRDIQEVFRIFQDKEFGEGCVTETSLRHIMGLKPALASSLTPDEIDEIFGELGIKRRDVIDYRQFMEDISSGFVKFE